MPYLTVQAPTNQFQNPQNQTNAYIDTRFYPDMKCGGNYSFTMIDKRGINNFFFASPQDFLVSEIGPLILRKVKPTTWIENFAETKTISKVQLGSHSIVEKLKSFAALEANWDSYDAKPIEWSTIIRAIKFSNHILYAIDSQDKDVVPRPFIAPRSDGGVQFEWSTCYKELILTIPAKENELMEYLKTDINSGEEKEEEGEVSSIEELVHIVTDWLL
jgi:hypothetical protein